MLINQDILLQWLNVLESGHKRNVVHCPEMKTDPSEDTGPKDPFRIYTSEGFGAAIRHYRRAAGLSQAELAHRAGLNRTYLSYLEKGKETEHLRRLFRVLRQLGLRITLQKADS